MVKLTKQPNGFFKKMGDPFPQDVVDMVVHEYIENKKSFLTIAKELGCSRTTVQHIYYQSGLKSRNDSEKSFKYSVNDNYFEIIDTEEKAYWLGFLYADGYIQNARKHSNKKVGITLSSVDREHLEKFKKAISFTGPVKDYIDHRKRFNLENCKISKILITSEKMAKDLIDKGCVEHKTNILSFPSEEIVPKELQIDFIRGLIDGDGSVVISNSKYAKFPTYYIGFTGTEDMCNNIGLILCNKTYALQKRHKNKDTNNYSFTIGGNLQVVKVLKLLYGNATVYLDRKHEKYKQIIELEKIKDELNPKRINRCSKIKVKCVETGVIYDSCDEAAKANGLVSGTTIRKCIRKEQAMSANLHWERVNT